MTYRRGEEEGLCDYSGACPPARGAHNGGDQYLWSEGGGGVLELWSGWLTRGGGGQYPPGGGGEAARLWKTLSMASWVVGLYKNPVT
jgi:hypothetical protein